MTTLSIAALDRLELVALDPSLAELGVLPTGPRGAQGWSAVYAVVEDGARGLLQLVDWIGSVGTKPAVGSYLGIGGGFVEDIEDAFDFRGVPGFAGWSPVFALVADGTRFVFRIADWTGGAGVKPDTGLYIGATGYVADIADAVNVRGPQGLPGGDGEDGDNGWTAVEVDEADGDRILKKVVDWIGGDGVKPAVDLYRSAAGYTADKPSATDYRGLPGTGSNPAVFLLIPASSALVAGNAYRITATSAATLTLPASPASGDTIRLVDGETISATVQHIVARNGNTIMGLAEDMTLNIPGLDVTIWWSGSDWRLF